MAGTEIVAFDVSCAAGTFLLCIAKIINFKRVRELTKLVKDAKTYRNKVINDASGLPEPMDIDNCKAAIIRVLHGSQEFNVLPPEQIHHYGTIINLSIEVNVLISRLFRDDTFADHFGDINQHGTQEQLLSRAIFSLETAAMSCAEAFLEEQGFSVTGFIYDCVLALPIRDADITKVCIALSDHVQRKLNSPITFHVEDLTITTDERESLSGSHLPNLVWGNGGREGTVQYFVALLLAELSKRHCVIGGDDVLVPSPDLPRCYDVWASKREVVNLLMKKVCSLKWQTGAYLDDVVKAFDVTHIAVPTIDTSTTNIFAFRNGRVEFLIDGSGEFNIYITANASVTSDDTVTDRVFPKCDLPLDGIGWCPQWNDSLEFQDWTPDTIQFFEAQLFR